MFQVRIHGRTGQGVVTTAELLADAAVVEGRQAVAAPRVDAGRTGTPVAAYCRISTAPVRLREPVYCPDAVLVQDPSLRHQLDLFAGLAPGGFALVNSVRSWEDLGLDAFAGRLCRDRTIIVPASELSLVHTGRPLPGAAMLGGFAALTGQVSQYGVVAAMVRRFSLQVSTGEAEAARAGYRHVAARRRQLANV
jgi:pyruvate ferredoxin oxidoreductase gamma subunit